MHEETCLANEIKIIFNMIAMKGQLWDLHLSWQLSKVYLSTRRVIDAINISAESRSFRCHIIDCICESNQMFMAIIALLLLCLCHRGQRLQVFPFKSLFDTFRQLKCTFMKGKWGLHWSTVVDIQGPHKQQGPWAYSANQPLHHWFSVRVYSFFLFFWSCADMINKLQICC